MHRFSRPLCFFRRLLLCTTPRKNFSSSSTFRIMPKSNDLYAYTSGKWLWNNEHRQAERRKEFNVPKLKVLAAAAVDRSPDEIVKFEKLAEGGYNRTFLISMSDGFHMVARIPYPSTEPKQLLIASEVATMDYLLMHQIPVPKVYGYSTSAKNPAETEYIFMEFVSGTNLGDIWHELGENARIKVVERLVKLESRLLALDFPASGSLFYTKDLDSGFYVVPKKTKGNSGERSFSIGPDMTPGLWFGKRLTIETFRGPYREIRDILTSGAEKEIKFLQKFGHPIHPFQRLRRESCNYQRQSHVEYIDLLEKYLSIVPLTIPPINSNAVRPALRHPDLQPNNVFVSNNLEITGLIDWQHANILPLYLQAGIPGSFQNYGDTVSESLELPALPESFSDMDENLQFQQVLLLRKRQLHYHYVIETMKHSPQHGDILADAAAVLRRKLFTHSSDPWEGDNFTLKADLIDFTKVWSVFRQSNPARMIPPCPIEFSEVEQQECYERTAAMREADEQFQTCLDFVGAGPDGWVPLDHFEDARKLTQKLKAETLEDAESEEERAKIQQHWPFDDFDEAEYS